MKHVKRSVWVLMSYMTKPPFTTVPEPRAVYFSKRDGEKRIEWLQRSATGKKFEYWLERIPFFEDSRAPNN